MDQSTFMVVVAVATGIAALALVLQACFLFGTYKATQAMRDRIVQLVPKVEAIVPKVEALVPKVDALLDSSRATIEESRMAIAEVRSKSNAILDTGHRQMKTLETLLGDASTRTQRQMEHAEALVADTLSRAEDTVSLVHRGIMKPIRGVTGVAAGVAAAVQMLMRGSRTNPDQVTIDEEMFI
jgi:biopolymer transport protein ExbB/TolQ